MSPRFGLIVVQAIGAISILPYPAILVANVMSIAAQGQTLRGAIPFLLLSAYPIVWVVLDLLGWVAFGRGSTQLAFGLSSIPLVVSAVAVAVFFSYFQAESKRAEGKLTSLRDSVRQSNPLSGMMLDYFDGPVSPKQPATPLEQVLEEIARSSQINDAVPEHGSPLGIALWNLRIEWSWDGTPANPKQQGALRIIQALVARGAVLNPEERNSLLHTGRLRLALLKGRNETERENSLVWEIVKGTLTARDPFTLTGKERALLHRTTRLYGTPLMASLLLPNNTYLSRQLILAGARLSPEEERDPAAKAELERSVLQRDPSLRAQYDR